jgi:hypothetical protein
VPRNPYFNVRYAETTPCSLPTACSTLIHPGKKPGSYRLLARQKRLVRNAKAWWSIGFAANVIDIGGEAAGFIVLRGCSKSMPMTYCNPLVTSMCWTGANDN